MTRIFKMHKAVRTRHGAAPLSARPPRRVTRAELDLAQGRAAADAPPARPREIGGPEGPARPREIGGPEGPEPTRYGDWERKGICYDF